MVVLHVDGGARGNPGPAAAGVVLRDAEGQALLEAGYLLGELTNNQAEYSALLLGLSAARRHGAERIRILSDSELMVKQVRGEFRVASPQLKSLYQDVVRELGAFHSWDIQHIRRELNRRADQLVNRALDQDEDVVEVDSGPGGPRLSSRSGAGDAAGAHRTAVVVVEWVEGPAAGRCPADCRPGQQFTIGSRLPAGLCTQAAPAVLDLALRLQAGSNEPAGTQASCGFPGCGARIQVRRQVPGDAVEGR